MILASIPTDHKVKCLSFLLVGKYSLKNTFDSLSIKVMGRKKSAHYHLNTELRDKLGQVGMQFGF